MSEQQTLGFDYDQPTKERSGQVVCLGITFENEEERRNYFTEKLREKLQDPEFRKIEGFPIGSDEDILALSDPPYYTACPNPWISDFIKEWESQKPEKPSDYKYHREPFAADVKEGKNDPIYNAHSYHTKVPHKAIMRYILHYTEPGDIIFDGFCGTGMTGVAAQMCGDRKTVESLGYQVQSDGTIMQQETDENGKTHWIPFSKLGVRRAVLNDLSPAATFIAYNYNTPVDVKAFEKEAKRILKEVEKECGWMYETKHSDGQIGKINYTVWSDVFICPECMEEFVFWDVAIKVGDRVVLDDFQCPNCKQWLSKLPANSKKEELKPLNQRRPNSSKAERSWISFFDSSINQTVKQAKQVPVLINYSMNGKRFEKVPDDFDLALIEETENCEIPYWFPTDRMMEGKESRRNDHIGITHVHHFFTKRNLQVLGLIYAKCGPRHKLLFQSIVATLCSRLVRYNMGKRGNGPLNGTLYISSLSLIHI